MTQHPTQTCIVIGVKHERPTLLSAELDTKLRAMIQNLRISGASINLHTVRGVLAGLVHSDVEKYGHYLDFQVAWVRSLYQRMKLSRHIAIMSRPIITCTICEEISTQYLYDISHLTKTHEI